MGSISSKASISDNVISPKASHSNLLKSTCMTKTSFKQIRANTPTQIKKMIIIEWVQSFSKCLWTTRLSNKSTCNSCRSTTNWINQQVLNSESFLTSQTRLADSLVTMNTNQIPWITADFKIDRTKGASSEIRSNATLRSIQLLKTTNLWVEIHCLWSKISHLNQNASLSQNKKES